MVYCRAKDFGLNGTEGPREIDSNQTLINALLDAQKAAGKLINAEADGIVAIAEPVDFKDHASGKDDQCRSGGFFSSSNIYG